MGMIGSAARQAARFGMIGLLGVDPVRMEQERRQRAALDEANRRAAGLFQPVPGDIRQSAVANAEGADITDAFGPVFEQGPSRQRSPAEMAAALAELQGNTRGFNAGAWKGLADLARPDIALAPDGTPYNKNDPAALAQRFRTPQAVNNTIVDMGNPENENRVIPSAPVPGAMPVYDNRGRVVDWQLPSGAAGAIAGAAQAESGGRARGSAPYEFINVPQPGGGSAVIAKSQAAGGVFQGQRPDDAAYAGETAKFAAEQFKGIQQAGQRAGSMIGTYNRIGQLLDGYATGRFTPTGKELASAASSLGIKVDPKWGNIEAADALSKKLALDAMGGSLGAGFSNADRQFVESMNPSIMNTPQGRKQMIDFGIARAQREQQIAGMARQWQQRAGRLDAPDRSGKTFFDYLEAWGEQNPLMGNR